MPTLYEPLFQEEVSFTSEPRSPAVVSPLPVIAVTLCIGIMASFFSALYVTRTFFMVYLNRRGSSESISI